MHDQIYSLMDLIQLFGTIFVCYVCYRAGFSTGVQEALDILGVVPEDEQEGEEK